MRPSYRSYQLLLHPIFIAALAVLIVNDAFLKWTFYNGITGKLSDIAGLIVLPIFLYSLFPKIKYHTVWVSGLFFLSWKLPISQPLIDGMNTILPVEFHRVVDYSDLWALIVLVVPFLMIKYLKNDHQVKTVSLVWASRSLLLIAFISLCSTSIMRRMVYETHNGDIDVDEYFVIKKGVDQVKEDIKELGYEIKEYKRPNYYHYPSDTVIDYISYFEISPLQIPRYGVDTLVSLNCEINEFDEKESQIKIINLTLSNNRDLQKWENLKRAYKFYKKQIKKEFINKLM